MALGKLTHYTIDLLLLSMLFAGIRRDTGYYLDPSQFSSYDVRRYLAKYLSYGEKAYDYFLTLIKYTGYFKLQRFNNIKRFVNDVNTTLNSGDRIQPLHDEEDFTEINSNHYS
ncbi:hypothetical protein DASC09_007830 [Saccharomycopsis crataegensis]|uniref:DUF1748-domain-containing protein n=1 Tax=Saccharomycopsis crataegensis TaxID=43959 RepID=A0AAV5QFF0_9ASCO|nr:hypothetical protein DASC09_007830 [Saccharomycopsis crataegensis]